MSVSETELESMSRDELVKVVKDLRRQVEQLESLRELIQLRGAETIDDAEIDDVWIAGFPLGMIADNANQRSQSTQSTVQDVNNRIDDIESRLTALEDAVNTDLRRKEYEQMDKRDKARLVQFNLIETAKDRPTDKAAMTYKEVKYLFNGQPSPGHLYDIMEAAGNEAGFSYQTRDENNNRITVDLGAVKESLRVHAANNSSREEGS
jgi:hypothetical protein